MTRIRAQGLSLREDERLPLRLLSNQPQMVGLPHNKSLHPTLPLLAILGRKRVGERTCEREDCGILPWMPLPFLRRPCSPPRPEKNWTA